MRLKELWRSIIIVLTFSLYCTTAQDGNHIKFTRAFIILYLCFRCIYNSKRRCIGSLRVLFKYHYPGIFVLYCSLCMCMRRYYCFFLIIYSIFSISAVSSFRLYKRNTTDSREYTFLTIYFHSYP